MHRKPAAQLERRHGGGGTDGDSVQFAAPQSKKPCSIEQGFLGCNSLTITYFHTGTRTIIGVESFHGPVRDGKGWDQLAMVIRHDLLPRRVEGLHSQLGRRMVVVSYRLRGAGAWRKTNIDRSTRCGPASVAGGTQTHVL